MPEPKAQLIDPQGPIDVPGLSVTGVTTATGGFVGAVQGAATGLASTTANLSVGIVTATKFQGNTTGNVSGLADGTNINVGIITSTSFTGDLVGNAAGLSTTTANINAGIMSATSFAGNFTGVASGITGTPNIVVGIMTGTLKGDGSSLTGIAATNWITNNVTANSGTTAIDLALGNVVKFTQSANTTVSFANTGTSNIVSFIRVKDSNDTTRTLTWPSSIKWNGGSAPNLVQINPSGEEFDLITLLTRDEGVTWYGWLTSSINKVDGSLFAVGFNDNGQLGQNNTTKYSSPVQISGSNWSSFANNNARANHMFTFKDDNTLWFMGYSQNGESGLSSYTDRSSPTQVPGTWSTAAAGPYMSFGIRTNGTLWAWGYNGTGALGLNNKTSTLSPVQIGGGSDWSTVDSASYVGSAIKTDGTLWMWGNNQSFGKLGQNNRTNYSSPVQIPGTTWSSVSCAFYSTAAIKTDGTLWVWGNNDNGGLGQNSPENSKRSSPVQIYGGGTTWKTVGMAAYGSAAVKTDGTLWTWGANNKGQLGQNNKTNYSSPVQVPGTTWDDVDLGGTSAPLVVAVKTDGTLWSWGYTRYGSAGNNTSNVQYSSPVQIPGTDWSNISATNYRSHYISKI